MKNLKKKIAALGASMAVLASSVMSMSASAGVAEEHYDWGPRYWTPYTGYFSASPTVVSVRGLLWSEAQVSFFRNKQASTLIGNICTEYEFRPVGYKPYQIWSGSTSYGSNMPGAYIEDDDPDDVTVGSKRAADFVAGTSYYHNMVLTPVSGAPANARYIFESEYGNYHDLILYKDDWPYAFEQYDKQTTYFGNQYYW